MNQKLKASLQILLSGFLFGFLGIWGKWAFSLGLAYGELLSLRFSLASLILLSVLMWRHHKFQLRFPWLPIRELVVCLMLGAFGYAVFASCYFISLKGLSISMAVLLLYLYPVFVAIGARIFLQEKLGQKGVLAIALSTVGLTLLVWGDFSIHKQSSFFIGIFGALTYSIYVLVSRKYLKYADSVTSAFWMQLSTATVLLLIHFHSLDRLTEVVKTGWAPVLAISIFSTIFSMALFLQGLKFLNSAHTSILSTSEPITAILAAHFILGESMSAIQIGGGSLVLLAMLLVAK